MSLVLALTFGALYAVGTFVVLQREVSRVVLGLALLGHASVLLLLFAAGPRGRPAFVDASATEPAADPLPQALALTAIVITFGVLLLLLALAYRSWQLTGDDVMEDDPEDARIARGRTAEDDVERDAAALERDLEDR